MGRFGGSLPKSVGAPMGRSHCLGRQCNCPGGTQICNLFRISTAYTHGAPVTSTGARQPAHTARTLCTLCTLYSRPVLALCTPATPQQERSLLQLQPSAIVRTRLGNRRHHKHLAGKERPDEFLLDFEVYKQAGTLPSGTAPSGRHRRYRTAPIREERLEGTTEHQSLVSLVGVGGSFRRYFI
ncbi:hypothetical protein VTK56DRAFT_5900 [Thermocarpiscus australiensis]